jgi:hypothetical protein
MTGTTGILRVNLYKFMIISHLFHLKLRIFSDKFCRENIITHFMFSNVLKKLACNDIMLKSIVELDRLQMTIWRMRIAC